MVDPTHQLDDVSNETSVINIAIDRDAELAYRWNDGSRLNDMDR